MQETWEGLCAGKSGIAELTHFDTSQFRTRIGGELKGFDPTQYFDQKDINRMDPFCIYAATASKMALEDAGIDWESGTLDADRIGVYVSSGIGGIQTFEEQSILLKEQGPRRVSPFFVPMMISDMAAGMVSILFGLRGPNLGIVSACATGAHSIGEAYWVIKRGDADIMLAGGAEAACASPIGIAGFCAARALSTRNDEPEKASRPFDRDRDGFVMADGAAVLILESLESARRRGANIYGEIVGYGATADAYHITSPHPEGTGACRAIEMCLKHAGLNPEDVEYVNAHGTSTKLNDKFETAALKRAFGDHARNLLISSTKSLTGHALGAAGSIEVMVCLLAIKHGVIPGTWNYETPDPDCDLNYIPNQTLEKKIEVALTENFGFGGHNAVLAIRRFNG